MKKAKRRRFNIMRYKICAITVIAMGIMLASAVAADVTGKWVAEFPGKGGDPVQMVFNLKADGANLTGTMAGPMGNENPISDGKVEGDNVTFNIKLNFGGNEMKMLYNGKVTGDEMKLTMEMEGGMGGPGGGQGAKPMEITAKRQQ
jgi:hypothetical protein